VLLVLGKRRVCAQLSVQAFARSLNLTPAETRVLELLCAGVRPTLIAQTQGVAVSTVRTQIGSIRAKTGAASISALVRQVAVLPPLVGALRGGLLPAAR
jgi:DNA-binding CsgD family transcriptional regulator